jgi:hypothetical protein
MVQILNISAVMSLPKKVFLLPNLNDLVIIIYSFKNQGHNHIINLYIRF